MELQTLTKHVLYIGLNDKDSKVQEITTDKAKEIISETFGDCTISDALGVYTHEDGTKVKEKSLRVELLFKADKEVIENVQKIKKLLNQETVGFEVQKVNSTLI